MASGDDGDRSGGVWAVAITFLILTWVTTTLRVYVRAGTIGNFGADDKAAVVAQVLFTGYLICQFGGVINGTGQKLNRLNYAHAELALRFWFFCEVWYSLASTAVRISILLSLRRVTVKRIHLWIIWGLVIWSICLGMAFFLGIIFQCIPASDWWSLNPADKHCLPVHIITSLTYTVSALNIALDWTLGIFPFFIVKDLAIPFKQKILVGSILAFGALASTATCVRIAYIQTLDNTYLGWNGNFLYDTTPVAIWTTIESGVAITAMSVATLRPLVNKLFGLSSSYTGTPHRSTQTFSPYTSADCTGPRVQFNSFRNARANALAIIDADDEEMDPPAGNNVGFSHFDPNKAAHARAHEVHELDSPSVGSSWYSKSKWSPRPDDTP